MYRFFIRFAAGLVAFMLLLAAAADCAAKGKGSGGVIRLEETVIEGRVQKPNAFFINTRQGMVYEVMEIKESFIEEISKVVESGEF
jgi:hypothetical protein